MKKIFGFLVARSLILIGVILSSPFLLGMFLLMLANKVQCWSTGQHVYDYRLVLSGMHVSQLKCTRCTKPIVVDEHSSVLKQANDFINSLHKTKDFLNSIFTSKTPEEQAVDDLLNETRGNSQED